MWKSRENKRSKDAGLKGALVLGVFLILGAWSMFTVPAEVIRQQPATSDPAPVEWKDPNPPAVPVPEEKPASAPSAEGAPGSKAEGAPESKPEEISPVGPRPSATAQDNLLVLPGLAPVEEAKTVQNKVEETKTVQKKVERPLEVIVEGKGALAPNAMLLAEPGQVFSFQAKLTQENVGDKNAGLTSDTAQGKPRRLALESNRRIVLESTGGVTKSFTPVSAVWQAPSEPGLQKVTLEVEESFSRRSEGAGGGGPQASSDMARGSRVIPVMVQYPFDRAGSGILDGYAIGIYPNEKGSNVPGIVQRSPSTYEPPKWFVKVTKETREMYVSPHFRLGDFASPGEKGRDHFVAIQPNLIAFLEEVWKTAQKDFGESARVVVLRAYLSPNEALRLEQKGVRYTAFTRYLYGDAAAVVVDLDGKGLLGDLNRDGRVDREDANQLADMLERVQDAMKVQGGLGVVDRPLEPGWPETPYAVVDLRGVRSRW